MQVWNVLHAARWKCRTQKMAKKSPSGHHRTTLSGYIFATKARIDNRKKNLLSSNIPSTCPDNMVNFGALVCRVLRAKMVGAILLIIELEPSMEDEEDEMKWEFLVAYASCVEWTFHNYVFLNDIYNIGTAYTTVAVFNKYFPALLSVACLTKIDLRIQFLGHRPAMT